MGWQDYRAAPPPGTVLCSDAAVDPVASVQIAGPQGRFPVLILRGPKGLRAYVNACPHQYLPLDHLGPQILSADGARLTCTVHGAQFDAATGTGLTDAACALDPIPVHSRDGQIVIG